jgi:hypothetical protein
MRRVIVYIDGFNLYHAIDRLGEPALKWLDLTALSGGLLRTGETLAAVKYFSALATWRPSHHKHRRYVAALEATGVEVILGQFKKKPRRCPSCHQAWTTHEEKETDVHIAVQMVADALGGVADRLILISADTDLSPPIKTIARLAPACEVFVATPPGRFAICRALGPQLEITPGRLRRALLPSGISLADGRLVECPPEWQALIP